MKQTPQIVKDAADYFIEMYGGNFDYLGKYEGADVYMYHFPEDADIGFPFVYIHKDDKVSEITGFEALDIVSLLVEDVDEVDIE